MTTANALITRIRSHPLLGGRRPTIDRLDGNISASDTTLTVEFSNPLIRPGTYIEIEQELMYVTGGTLPSVNVVRDVDSEGNNSHSDGDIITLDPRWTRWQIMHAMQDEIRSWPNDLCAIATVDLTFPSNATAVDITGSLGREIRRVFRCEVQSSETGVPIKKLDVELLTRQPTSVFTSGNAIQITNALTFPSSSSVRLTYGYLLDLDNFSFNTDLEVDLGLSPNLWNILIAGTVWRLLLNTEAELTGNGTASGSQLIQPTHRIQAAQAAREDRDRLIHAEIRRIYDEFGLRGG